MEETPLFIDGDNYRLFAVLHGSNSHTSSSGQSTRPFLVICHPFAEESIISRRVVTNLARKLAAEGFPCMRFDYMGEGDSDGCFEDSTVASRLSDIAGAIAHAREKIGANRIGLVGIRFGATLAATACSSIQGIDPLIMIAPITDGRSYLGQLLRSNLAFQMAAYRKIVQDRESLLKDLNSGTSVNVDGYLLTSQLYREINEMKLKTIEFDSSPRMLVLDINKSEKQPAKKDLVSLCEHYQSRGMHVDLETVADQFFWADGRIHKPSASRVENDMMDWLNRNYR